MKLLLDTHTYIWWCQTPHKIRESARTLIEDAENEIYISVASPWEMTIKQQKGKLTIDTAILRPDRLYGFELLSITTEHTEAYAQLPLLHRDPFDRIMLAQAMAEELTFVTHDRNCLRYTINGLNLLEA